MDAPLSAWGQQKPRTAPLWRAASETQAVGIQPSAGSKRRRLSEQPLQSSSCAPAALFVLAACFLVAARWAQGIKLQQLLKQPAGSPMAAQAAAPERHLAVSMLLLPGMELKPASGRSASLHAACKSACMHMVSCTRSTSLLLASHMRQLAQSCSLHQLMRLPASCQLRMPAQSACLQGLSKAQREGVLLMARLWRLERSRGASCQAEQLAAKRQLLLLEAQLASIAQDACTAAACEALTVLDSSGQLAVAFRQQPA